MFKRRRRVVDKEDARKVRARRNARRRLVTTIDFESDCAPEASLGLVSFSLSASVSVSVYSANATRSILLARAESVTAVTQTWLVVFGQKRPERTTAMIFRVGGLARAVCPSSRDAQVKDRGKEREGRERARKTLVTGRDVQLTATMTDKFVPSG